MSIAPTLEFTDFLERLKDPGAPESISPMLLADRLGLPAQKFASVARVHRNTLGLTPTSPKLQDAMVDVVRVLSAAHELTGDMDRAIFWFRNHPIADFSHHTAMQLVEMGRAQAVIDYVDSLGAGATG